MTLLLPPIRAKPALAIAVSLEPLYDWWSPRVLNGIYVRVLGGKSWLSPEPWWPHCTGDVISTKSQNLQSSSLGRGTVEEGGHRGQILVSLGMV